MRRSEKEIKNRAEIDKIIQDSDICRLAFAVHNEPYLVPVSFGYDGACIFIHTAKKGRKIDCINANNRVCFEFERNVSLVEDKNKPCKWDMEYESVIGYGNITELHTFEQKTIGLNCIMDNYSGQEWEFSEKDTKSVRVWKILITSVAGKRSIKKNT